MITRTILPTDGAVLSEFFREMRGPIHVAFEEGAQEQWRHRLLTPVVDRVIVCKRGGQASQGNKADQLDADAPSELLRQGGLPPVYHASPHGGTLKQRARTSASLVGDRQCVRIGSTQWLRQLPGDGGTLPGDRLDEELEIFQELRPQAKRAMVA